MRFFAFRFGLAKYGRSAVLPRCTPGEAVYGCNRLQVHESNCEGNMLPPKALAHPWAWTLRQRLRPPALPRSAHLLAAAVIEPSGAAHSLAPVPVRQS